MKSAFIPTLSVLLGFTSPQNQQLNTDHTSKIEYKGHSIVTCDDSKKCPPGTVCRKWIGKTGICVAIPPSEPL